jgi:hypothetical protein
LAAALGSRVFAGVVRKKLLMLTSQKVDGERHYEVPPLKRAYRIQEIDQGGLGKATRRKLQTITKNLRKAGRVGPTPSLALKPGVRLVREWPTVTVTGYGFEYAGTSWPTSRQGPD